MRNTVSQKQFSKQITSRHAIKSLMIPAFNFLIVSLCLTVYYTCESIYSKKEEGLLMWICLPFFIIGSIGIFAMFITPVFGIMYGRKALKQIKESKGDLVGRRWAISGIVLSLVMWALMLIAIILQ